MRKSLYIKFVISYLVLAFIGFFAVSMLGSSMVHNHLDSVYSTSLYQEATNIAKTVLLNIIGNRLLWKV